MNYHWSEILFAVGFIAYVFIRDRFIRKSKLVESEFNRLDFIERLLFVVVFVGNMLLPIVYLLTPLLWFADYRLPQLVPWCGAILMPLALWLFLRSHLDLGDFWSVTLEIRKDHRLVETGVYRSIRHPMYAAILLFGIAQGMLLWNWLAGWSSLVSFALLYFIRTPREEQMMQEVFGEEYTRYMSRTGRIIPRLFRSNSP